MLDSFTLAGLAEYEQAAAREKSCRDRNVLTYNPKITDRSPNLILFGDTATGPAAVTVTDA